MSQQQYQAEVMDQLMQIWDDLPPEPKEPARVYVWADNENRTCGYCGAIKPNPWECKSCRNFD